MTVCGGHTNHPAFPVGGGIIDNGHTINRNINLKINEL